jgi:hypothetical protein
MIRGIVVRLLSVCAFASVVSAQPMRFFYPPAASGAVTVSRAVPIGVSGLTMDIHRPAGANRLPALIFFNLTFGPPEPDDPFYTPWAQAAAINGVVGIRPVIRSDSARQDFMRALDYVTAHASDYGIDPNAIAVYAGSGNVYTALPIVEDPTTTRVKAAVMFYGTGPVTQFRRDLPLLFVRAGLDRPGVNTNLVQLASLALSQNAPISVMNDAGGHHGFEIVDDDAATRDAIERTIDFVKRATAPAYQAALRTSMPEITASAHVSTRNFAAAAAIYRDLVNATPEDSRLRLSYGEALLGDAKFAEACAQLAQLRGKGLGYRDLGVPAARACAQAGDQDAAVGWLKSIPSQFRPRDLETDAAFTSLRGRADFRALFTPPD